MTVATKSAEVRRILERYLVEIVERYDLCPWARTARTNHELAIEIVWDTPAIAGWIAAIEHALADPAIRVAMIVAPELAIEPAELRALRDRVAASLPTYGIAEFHPSAELDLTTPARLVPYLRRSPDPMLQVVPLALLDGVRSSPVPDRAGQAKILAGAAGPPRDVAAQIAAANHAAVTVSRIAIEETLAAIAEDRRVGYARAGLSACR